MCNSFSSGKSLLTVSGAAPRKFPHPKPMYIMFIFCRGEIKRPDYIPSLAGKTGLERLREEADKREEELARQLKLGQRVLVQVKKSSKS